jgi:hypothetical protein
LRHLDEVSQFLVQVNYPHLAEALDAERERLKAGMKR